MEEYWRGHVSQISQSRNRRAKKLAAAAASSGGRLASGLWCVEPS